jgi:hypothetical protein
MLEAFWAFWEVLDILDSIDCTSTISGQAAVPCLRIALWKRYQYILVSILLPAN